VRAVTQGLQPRRAAATQRHPRPCRDRLVATGPATTASPLHSRPADTHAFAVRWLSAERL
jgi:hypothetical protein